MSATAEQAKPKDAMELNLRNLKEEFAKGMELLASKDRFELLLQANKKEKERYEKIKNNLLILQLYCFTKKENEFGIDVLGSIVKWMTHIDRLIEMYSKRETGLNNYIDLLSQIERILKVLPAMSEQKFPVDALTIWILQHSPAADLFKALQAVNCVLNNPLIHESIVLQHEAEKLQKESETVEQEIGRMLAKVNASNIQGGLSGFTGLSLNSNEASAGSAAAASTASAASTQTAAAPAAPATAANVNTDSKNADEAANSAAAGTKPKA